MATGGSLVQSARRRTGLLALPVTLSVLAAASIAAELLDWVLPAPLAATPWIQPCVTHSGLILFSLVAARIAAPEKSRLFGFRRCRLLVLIRAGAAGLILGLIANGAAALLRLPAPDLMRNYSIAQQIILVWCWASLAEEALLRGLLQGMMAVWADRPISLFSVRFTWPAVASALFFAAMHLPLRGLGTPWTTVWFIVSFAFVLGLAAARFRHVTGSLWPAVAAHAAANATGTLFQLLR